PLGALTVDASSAGTARVFVAHPRATLLPSLPAGTRPSVGAAVGRSGLVNVLRDLGPGSDFSGQTALVDGEIDTDIEDYLVRSEQIESALACEAWLDGAGQVRAAVGVLVQALPNGEGAALVARARERLRAGALGKLLAQGATEDVDPELVMITALAEDVSTLRLLGENPVRFHCPCSRARAASTLALLGEEDLLALIQEEGQADVTCEFCREHYAFTDASLEEIRHGVRRHAPLPS
ncbi:MAG TPA: Hsp33 family molecular chaperone HslO, partial [Polyangia bacterium]|nr:Hsp33 family molecular chaperone HslO [Polyangia bacterium]